MSKNYNGLCMLALGQVLLTIVRHLSNYVITYLLPWSLITSVDQVLKIHKNESKYIYNTSIRVEFSFKLHFNVHAFVIALICRIWWLK